jgi:hypothetical protein
MPPDSKTNFPIYLIVPVIVIFILLLPFYQKAVAKSVGVIVPSARVSITPSGGNPGMEVPLQRYQGTQGASSLSLIAPVTDFYNAPMPTPKASFTGVNMRPDNNTPSKVHTPPDTHAAAGLDRIIEVTNGHVAIYTKSGSLIAGGDSGSGAVDLDDFCGDLSSAPACFDPKIIYDQYADRFVAIALDGRSFTDSRLHMMVSNSGSPQNLTTDWTRFTFALGSEFNGIQGWFDYPGLGVSPEALVVTGNIFADLPIPLFLGTKIRIFDKNQLYTRDSDVTYFDIDNQDLGDFTIQPAHHFGNPPTGTFYLVNRYNRNTLKVWAITGLPDSPQAQTAYVTTQDQGDCVFTAPQKGTTKQIDTVCPRMMDAVWRSDSLWSTLTGSNPGDTRSVVQWFEIQTEGFPDHNPTLRQQGTVDGGAGEFTYMPSIGVDQCGDVGIIYTQSSQNRYPEIRYTGRLSDDPLYNFREPYVVKTSPGFYDDFAGSTGERWGDFSSTVIDPDEGSFWMAQEYVKATPSVAGNDGQWGTWHANFSFECDPTRPSNPKSFMPLALSNYNEFIVFQDDFSTDKGWFQFSDSTGAAGLQGGEYRLYNVQPDMVLRALAPVTDTAIPATFSLQSQMRRISGEDSQYGLVFNWLKSDEFYTFVISSQDQSFSIWKFDAGWQQLSHGISPEIHTGDKNNLLRIERLEGEIRAYANNALLAVVYDSTYAGGRTGLDLWTGDFPSEARFDNFTIGKIH